MIFGRQNIKRKLSYERTYQHSLTKIKKGLAFNIINCKFQNKNSTNQSNGLAKEETEKGVNTVNSKEVSQQNKDENSIPRSNRVMTFGGKTPFRITFINQLQETKQKRIEKFHQNKLRKNLFFQDCKKMNKNEAKELQNKTDRLFKNVRSFRSIKLGSKLRQKTIGDIQKEDNVHFENFLVSSALTLNRGRSGKIHKLSNTVSEEILEKEVSKINILGLKAFETDLIDHFRLKTANEGVRVRNRKINPIIIESIGISSKVI